MFSDMEMGTKIVLLVVFGAMIFFGGKNVFSKGSGKNSSNNGNKGNGAGTPPNGTE